MVVCSPNPGQGHTWRLGVTHPDHHASLTFASVAALGHDCLATNPFAHTPGTPGNGRPLSDRNCVMAAESHMTYVVTENCIRCKYMDCTALPGRHGGDRGDWPTQPLCSAGPFSAKLDGPVFGHDQQGWLG
jgi:hypothetical protein